MALHQLRQLHRVHVHQYCPQWVARQHESIVAEELVVWLGTIADVYLGGEGGRGEGVRGGRRGVRRRRRRKRRRRRRRRGRRRGGE
jgi:hypothetical protein